jgi:hypothetical protein
VKVFGQEKDSNPSQKLNYSAKGQRFVAWPVHTDFSPKSPAHLTPPSFAEYLCTFWLRDVQTRPLPS